MFDGRTNTKILKQSSTVSEILRCLKTPSRRPYSSRERNFLNCPILAKQL